MRKPLGFLLLLALLFMGVRQSNPIAIATLINGEPTTVGVLTSAGASVTNASTAVPFVLTGVTLRVITIQCDATTFVGFGANTCGVTTATSNGCFIIRATDPPKVVILQDSTTSMNAAGGAAFNCIVDKLL